MKLKEQKTRSLRQELHDTQNKLRALQAKYDEQEMFFAREAKNVTGRMLPFNPSFFKDSNAYYVNQFYRQMIEKLPGHFYWIDRNQYIMGFNQRQVLFFGMNDLSSCYGKHVFDLCGLSEESKLIVENNKEVMDSKKPCTFEETYTKDGNKDHWVSEKTPLYDPRGELIGLVGMSVNIDKEKKNEERLQRMIEEHEKKHQSRMRMFLDIAHDLRSPFTGLVSLSQHLLLMEKDPLKNNLIAEMYDSSKRALEFMEELFDRAADLVSENDHSTGIFSLNRLFEDIHQMLLPNVRISERDLQLILNLPEKTIWIGGRRLMFSRIILNLAANAIKFTQQGFVRMSCSVHVDVSEKRKIIKFSISDTGVGMAPDDLDRIFEDFTILPQDGLSYKSTGLGLGLVNRFVSELGGYISIKSEVGVGTRFTCWLPLDVFDQPDEPKKASLQQLINQPTDVSGRSRVLLIEDEPVAQKAAVLMLERVGCSVTVAGSVVEVKKLFSDMNYDVIFIDYCLHGSKGFDLIPALKKKLPNVLVVGLSAQSDRHVLQGGFLNDMDYFVSKPLSYEKLNCLFERMKVYTPEQVNLLDPDRVIID
jgi:two-component system, OmpR family, aerobic respiration control sensor histidine kinase ArcB